MDATMMPVALYGIQVAPGTEMTPAAFEFPATIRITMAAIDPTAAPEPLEDGTVPKVPRSTLRIIKAQGMDDEDDDSYFDGEEDSDEDDDEEEEEEANGGPSDPAKSKKARREAAIRKLLEATQEESDEEMEDVSSKAKKGKGKATEEDDEEDSEDDESDDGEDITVEDFVVCTLDTERHYQQTLDIVIGEGEHVFFAVTGTHPVYVTGNYMIPHSHDDESDDEDDEDYDLSGLDMDVDSDDMSDELDNVDGVARVEEIESDEEPPKLVKAKKGKKRAAEEDAEGLDEMIAKEEEPKLSKKQQKKLKNNKGEAIAAEEAKPKESPAKGDKKVQFAKNLEQGPTGPAKDAEKKGATASVKVVQGVTIDDRKPGQGRTVKNGDKVGMRYIGKLQNGKVFDSNKKGPPFSFKIGKGEVIKGWDIGIMGMAIGGERRLTIPAHLAYGSKGVPGIPPNSTLIFDVKLLEIK